MENNPDDKRLNRILVDQEMPVGIGGGGSGNKIIMEPFHPHSAATSVCRWRRPGAIRPAPPNHPIAVQNTAHRLDLAVIRATVSTPVRTTLAIEVTTCDPRRQA